MKTNLLSSIPYSNGKVFFYPVPFGPATRYYTEKLSNKMFVMFAELSG
jgi:hypothetical protein